MRNIKYSVSNNKKREDKLIYYWFMLRMCLVKERERKERGRQMRNIKESVSNNKKMEDRRSFLFSLSHLSNTNLDSLLLVVSAFSYFRLKALDPLHQIHL